ncbi:MAG: hypothetical protein OXN90_13725, partial [Gemmatimonadota bacterium]|nr:hypothetical protein [Gemmatimonadota bacterium]
FWGGVFSGSPRGGPGPSLFWGGGGGAAGRPASQADCQIAAIARSQGMVVATRNVRDFMDTGIDVIDPWTT